MPFELFRADNRDPDTIARDGFQGRVQLNENSARQFVERTLIDGNAALDLPRQARDSVMGRHLDDNPGRVVGITALYSEIRRETSQSTLHVSTSPSEGVGGMDSRSHMYRISMPMDQLYAWRTDRNRLGEPTAIQSFAQARESDNSLGLPSTRPVLLTDTPDLNRARVLAIYSPAGDGEVAFLSGVPREWVSQGRTLPHGDWQSMPGQAQGRQAPAATTAQPTQPSATPAPQQSATNNGAPPVPPRPAALAGFVPAPSQAASSSASPAAPWTSSASSTRDYADGLRPPPLPARPLSMLTHPFQEPGHPKHALYEQARDGLQQLQPQRPIGERTLAAAALAEAAHAQTPPLARIDHVAEGPNGRLFAIHGEPRASTARYAFADPAQVQAQAQVASDYAAGRAAPSQAASSSQSAPAQATLGQHAQAAQAQTAPQQQQEQQPQAAQQEGGGNRVRALAAMFETPTPDPGQNPGGARHR